MQNRGGAARSNPWSRSLARVKRRELLLIRLFQLTTKLAGDPGLSAFFAMTLKTLGSPALLSLIHLDAGYGVRVLRSPGAAAHPFPAEIR